MRYVWTNGDRSITVDAKSLEDAILSFGDILSAYFRDTEGADWGLEVQESAQASSQAIQKEE